MKDLNVYINRGVDCQSVYYILLISFSFKNFYPLITITYLFLH